ncbi:MAG: J domain-containing protein [Treponema sp.]|nr:J domain-containing protein [Treponema sp.]
MMETIYDRLGDLLKETLDAGSVKFVRVEIPETEGGSQNKSGTQEKERENESAEKKPNERKKGFEDPADFVLKNERPREEYQTQQTGTVYHSSDAGKFSQREYIPKSFVYKKLTPEVENAYRILDIPTSSTADEIKKAYKEKIKNFHPDRYDGNEALTNLATDRTRQIVEAYKMISNFLEI